MSKQCKRLKKKKFRGKILLSIPNIYLYIPKRNSKGMKPFDKEPTFMELCNIMI